MSLKIPLILALAIAMAYAAPRQVRDTGDEVDEGDEGTSVEASQPAQLPQQRPYSFHPDGNFLSVAQAKADYRNVDTNMEGEYDKMLERAEKGVQIGGQIASMAAMAGRKKRSIGWKPIGRSSPRVHGKRRPCRGRRHGCRVSRPGGSSGSDNPLCSFLGICGSSRNNGLVGGLGRTLDGMGGQGGLTDMIRLKRDTPAFFDFDEKNSKSMTKTI